VPSYFTTKRATLLAAAGISAALALTGLTTSAASAATPTTATSAAATTASNVQLARYGAAYLARQITTNGGYVGAPGAPDVPDTAYAVLGLHAAGVGGAASNQAIAFLKTQLATLGTSAATDNPGQIAEVILAAVSAGQNPRQFGGTAAANNLVARLQATARTSGADKGLFGAAAPTFDGAFRQGLSLAALAAAGVPQSQVAASVSWLEGQQCANGLWTSYRSSVSTPCPAADPDTFAGPDTNSSGAAMQGLGAYGQHPRKAKALSAFRSIQTPDGGFPFLAAAGQSSDPDSIALSIQGLLGYGVGTALPTFRVGGLSPYTALAGDQLGCADAAAVRGAFFFPGDRTPNLFATVQAVPAMAHAAFPLAASTPSNALPTMPCATPTATTAAGANTAKAAVVKLAGTAGACKGTTGVTVAVDFTAFTGGKVQVRCAPGAPATGVAALQQAGFTPAGTATYGLAFICRINSLPSTTQQPCVTTPPLNAYWSYYHASHTATKWTYSTTGASTYKPVQGSIDAWAFGNTATPSKTPAQVRKAKS
jgi:hypothetical protein